MNGPVAWEEWRAKAVIHSLSTHRILRGYEFERLDIARQVGWPVSDSKDVRSLRVLTMP